MCVMYMIVHVRSCSWSPHTSNLPRSLHLAYSSIHLLFDYINAMASVFILDTMPHSYRAHGIGMYNARGDDYIDHDLASISIII